jgi:Fic family protein
MEKLGQDLQSVEPTPQTAFEALFRLANIHPFADGNSRAARILMNLILVGGGYRPVAVRPEDRAEHLDALKTATNTGDHRPSQRSCTDASSRP